MRHRILVYGYGLLSDTRDRVIAGQKMSGLTLYNSILLEGLRNHFDTSFVCGRIDLEPGNITYKTIEPLGLVAEYDARFPQFFEEQGIFQPNLARMWYSRHVRDLQNPIYSQLATNLLKVVDRIKPDLINVHNLNAACTLIHASDRLNVKCPYIVLTVHDIDIVQLEFVAENQELFSIFVAISQAVKNQLEDAGIPLEKIILIRNGLPLEQFVNPDLSQWSEVAKNLDIPENGYFQVLVPARRVPGKGIEYAIKAFASLSYESSIPMRLLITGADMGDDEHEQSLRKLVSRLKPKYPVVFLGSVCYEWMPYLYASSNVSLLPSVSKEGFGYANLEAMATGGPIVVTSNQGGVLDYLINLKTGILVEPCNVTAIHDALTFVLRNPDLVSQIIAQAAVTSMKYSEHSMIIAYVKLIECVITNKSKHVYDSND